MQNWCQLYQTGGVVGEGLNDLPTVRAPGEVVVLRCVNDDGQHLPSHDGCCLGSYGSQDLRVEHHCPVHARHSNTGCHFVSMDVTVCCVV